MFFFMCKYTCFQIQVSIVVRKQIRVHWGIVCEGGENKGDIKVGKGIMKKQGSRWGIGELDRTGGNKYH